MPKKPTGSLAASALCGVLLLSSGRAQAPARVSCEACENGVRAAASFRVLAAEQAIASGTCGKSVEVPAGDCQLVIALDGVLGAREQRSPVSARAGTTELARAHFETGELIVDVQRAGRRSVGLVTLWSDGTELAKPGAGVATRVVVGSYEVVVESRGEARRSDRFSVARGERKVVMLSFGSPPK